MTGSLRVLRLVTGLLHQLADRLIEGRAPRVLVREGIISQPRPLVQCVHLQGVRSGQKVVKQAVDFVEVAFELLLIVRTEGQPGLGPLFLLNTNPEVGGVRGEDVE